MTTFKALTHNLAGGVMNNGSSSALDETNAQIASWSPNVVMLQEVCKVQFDAFQAQHPDWSMVFTQMRPDHADCGPGPQGQVLASPWPMTDIVETDLGYPDGPKQFTLTHATITSAAGLGVRVGNTHLRAFTTAQAILARRRQCQKILATMAPYVDLGQVVCLGGDYNTTPGSDALDFLYKAAKGDFYEADQTDSNNTATRDGDPTIGSSKFDYLWFSSNSCSTTTLSGGVITATTSDHDIFRGSADVCPSNSLM